MGANEGSRAGGRYRPMQNTPHHRALPDPVAIEPQATCRQNLLHADRHNGLWNNSDFTADGYGVDGAGVPGKGECPRGQAGKFLIGSLKAMCPLMPIPPKQASTPPLESIKF